MYSVIIPIKDFKDIERLAIDDKHLLIAKIEMLSKFSSIDEIIVSTDSNFIKNLCEEFDSVTVHIREPELNQSFSDLVSEVSQVAKNDHVIWSFVTSPIDDEKVLELALQKYESLDLQIYDSLVTCTKLASYIFDENGPINFHQGKFHKESANLPDIFQLVNKFFIMKKELQAKYAYPWGKVPYPLIISKSQALDIKSVDELEIYRKVLIMIKILDCTLRDGAHVNGGAFGENAIKDVTYLLDKAGLDYIEVGFLTDISSEDKGNTLFNSLQDICDAIPSDLNSKISVMVRPDQCDIKKLDKKHDQIDTIRFAFHKKDLALTEQYITHALELGYEVCANPVNILSNTLEEVRDILDALSKYDLACISIVDTFGAFNEKSFYEFTSVFEESLNKDVAFGLHLHDNMLQAFGLVQSYIVRGEVKNIVIDSSLLGMGRAPGNLCTEIVTCFTNNELSTDYKMDYVFSAIEKHISPLKNSFEWGYNPIYMVTADLNIHRTYGEFLIENNVSVASAYSLLQKVKHSGKGNAFDRELINELLGR